MGLVLLHRILLTLAVGMLCSTGAFALDAIILPNEISGARGSVALFTVGGSLSADGNTRIVLEYPRDVIRIRSVKGGEGFGFRCPSALIEKDTPVTPTRSAITFDCWDTQPTSGMPLFAMEIEFLAGPGSVGTMKIISLERRGSIVLDLQKSEVTVTAAGSPALPEPVDGITGNYPNPFSATTDFVFRLSEPGMVTLSLITLDGRTVFTKENMQAKAGENVYHFEPNLWDIPSGNYVFSVQTETFTYLHQCMVLK